MEEQYVLVAHSDHVVVEDPSVDRVGGLLRKEHPRSIEMVQARDRARGLQGLPRWISVGRLVAPIEGAPAVDEEVQA